MPRGEACGDIREIYGRYRGDVAASASARLRRHRHARLELGEPPLCVCEGRPELFLSRPPVLRLKARNNQSRQNSGQNDRDHESGQDGRRWGGARRWGGVNEVRRVLHGPRRRCLRLRDGREGPLGRPGWGPRLPVGRVPRVYLGAPPGRLPPRGRGRLPRRGRGLCRPPSRPNRHPWAGWSSPSPPRCDPPRSCS